MPEDFVWRYSSSGTGIRLHAVRIRLLAGNVPDPIQSGRAWCGMPRPLYGWRDTDKDMPRCKRCLIAVWPGDA